MLCSMDMCSYAIITHLTSSVWSLGCVQLKKHLGSKCSVSIVYCNVLLVLYIAMFNRLLYLLQLDNIVTMSLYHINR